MKMADRFAYLSEFKKQTRWSNDKTIIWLGYRKISWFVSVSQSIICLSLWYFTQPRPISVKYFTNPCDARGLYVFPPKTKQMPIAETFILQKLPEATLTNIIKPKFQLPFGLLENQSCKSDTKRNKTDYNRQIYLSRAAKTNQLIRAEMDLHFKTASLPKSREKRSTDVLPFSSGFR